MAYYKQHPRCSTEHNRQNISHKPLDYCDSSDTSYRSPNTINALQLQHATLQVYVSEAYRTVYRPSNCLLSISIVMVGIRNTYPNNTPPFSIVISNQFFIHSQWWGNFMKWGRGGSPVGEVFRCTYV
jgi:hypothetical protein